MPHGTSLLATVASALGLAFVLGFAAHRVRLSPVVGYLLAGVIVGPFTPGYVANVPIAQELAEIGVIMLMFGVGLHFSWADLRTARRAIPGALVQVAILTALGASLAHAWGWPLGAGICFGLALSVSSTVLVLRTLGERGTPGTYDGRLAVAWLITQDIAMVLALVILPALAAPTAIVASIALTLAKVGAFGALMFVVGRRAVPWILGRAASAGSRELFTLAVLGIALGIAAGAAALFDVSLALGAFAAGLVLEESHISRQAAADALPLRDVFSVLFFVSVGMLFDPTILWRAPLAVAATLGVVVAGQTAAAFVILRVAREPRVSAMTLAASFAQIGEFSFILAALGVALRLLPAEGEGLVLASALLSVVVNPLLFAGFARLSPAFAAARRPVP